MTATLLDGKSLSETIRAEIRADVEAFTAAGGPTPCLAAVLVGDDPASQVYVRNKERACQKNGIDSRLIRLPANTTQTALADTVAELNADSAVHGILVQLPLPEGRDPAAIQRSVDPAKDVDAFHPENVGLLVQGAPRFIPCTPRGVMELLARTGVKTAGRRAVVIGRSDIVGKPLATLLAARGADATVTLCHSRTQNLAAVAREADILISAVGVPRFVTADMVRPGAVVIDVGVNRTDDGLVGDVDFAAVRDVAAMITPVPGGIGPLTITMLLANTLDAARGLHAQESSA